MSIFGAPVSIVSRAWNPEISRRDIRRHLSSHQTAPIFKINNLVHGLDLDRYGNFVEDDPLTSQQSIASIVARWERMHGTGDPRDQEHVRLGLLGMNNGDVEKTIQKLIESGTQNAIRNIQFLLLHGNVTFICLFPEETNMTPTLVRHEKHMKEINTLVRSLQGAPGKLVELYVGSSYLMTEEARMLADLQIKRLLISGNNLSDDGIIRSLAENNSLTGLDVRYARISENGVRDLANSPTLTELHLGRNHGVTDANVALLSNNSMLKTLNLENGHLFYDGGGEFDDGPKVGPNCLRGPELQPRCSTA